MNKTDSFIRGVLCLFAFLWAGILFSPTAGAASPEAGFFLRISEPSSGKIIHRLPLRLHETFTIRYIHSVDRTPVFEVFELTPEGVLAIRETCFKMFGAGMGHWEGRGVVDHDGRWTWIRGMHEPLGSFLLRVGLPSVDHTVLYRGREIHLSEKWAGRRLLVTVIPAEEGSKD